MTAALADPDTDTEVEQARVCDCRNGYTLDPCPNEAVWIYRHKCCAASTFVCETCHALHLALTMKVWRCRWCKTLGSISELMASMRRL